MRFYRFKTFRTSYYFPKITKETRFLYGLYNPYGNVLIRIYWTLFKNVGIFRLLASLRVKKINEPVIEKILRLSPPNSIVSINMGTPGEEQKVSILGYRPDAKESFFAKYAEKKEARRLAHNEIKILKKLEGKGIAPQLMSAVEEDDFVFFITSRVNGTLYKSNSISNRVIELAASISKIDISDRTQNKSLKESFSHGDFCPWNIMVENGELRLIDWEMAAIRPLGYDLFLFIIHANFVMGATCEYVTKVLRENQQAITFYFQQFDIKDYRPYLKHFVLDRIFVESGKRHIQMVEKYEQIAETFSLKTKI